MIKYDSVGRIAGYISNLHIASHYTNKYLIDFAVFIIPGPIYIRKDMSLFTKRYKVIHIYICKPFWYKDIWKV